MRDGKLHTTVGAAMAACSLGSFIVGLMVGSARQDTPAPTPLPVKACLPAEQVCPGWLFGGSLEDAKRRICARPKR
jgi:hypothetical protein